jgi:hypothetical protein
LLRCRKGFVSQFREPAKGEMQWPMNDVKEQMKSTAGCPDMKSAKPSVPCRRFGFAERGS